MTEATPRPWTLDSSSYVGSDGEAHLYTFIVGANGIEYDGGDEDMALTVAAVNADKAARALAEAAREVIRSADASDTWTSLIGILDEAQAAYRAARKGEADD